MKKYLISLNLILIVVLMASCGGDGNEAVDDRVVFRLNLTEEISSLDPAFARNQANTWGINQLYDGLVRLNSKMEIEPALATSWEISDDGLNYTFNLRRGVLFHAHSNLENRELKATDVVYSFKRLIEPGVASPGAWLLNGLLDEDSAFTALDDYTFRLRLNQPFRPLLSRLSMQYLAIVPDFKARNGEDFSAVPNFSQTPVGTGPFQLVSLKPGEHLILEKNPDYWEADDQGRKLPYIDVVNFSFQSGKSTEFLKFRQGDFDFVSDLDGALLKDVLTPDCNLQAAYEGQFELIKAPYLNTEYLGIQVGDGSENFAASPLKQRLVRQAINYGIDREKLISTLRQGKGIPATAGFVPPALYGAQDISDAFVAYTYQPEKAAKLLTEAGFPGGKGLPEVRLHTTAQYVDVCSFVANQLGDLGIPVKVEQVEGGLHYEMRVKGETEFFRASWIADYPDPESYLACFYSPNGVPPNYTRFQNAAFDQQLKQIVAEVSDANSDGAYRALDSLLMTHAPVVPLFYDEVLRFVQTGISGLEPNGINMLDLRRVHKH